MSTERRVAVYVDLENMTSADLGVILAFAQRHGHATVRRVYGDWSTAGLKGHRDGVMEHGFEAVQVFSARNARNSADIRLAIDVVEDLSLHPDVTDVVLATGDSDFVAVVQRCRRRGRRVRATGFRGRTSPDLVSACDTFAFYEELPAPCADPVPLALVLAAPDHRLLVVSALVELARSTADGWVPHVVVKPCLQRLAPGFDADKAAGTRFTTFLESMPELLEWKGAGAARFYRARPHRPSTARPRSPGRRDLPG